MQHLFEAPQSGITVGASGLSAQPMLPDYSRNEYRADDISGFVHPCGATDGFHAWRWKCRPRGMLLIRGNLQP